jgi:succinate dehydrogenase / fumarate reductase membrane anchor subunit
VTAHFAGPFPAIVTGLMIVVGFHHFRTGVQVLIEDYTHGLTRMLLIVAMVCLSYGAMATGLFALVRMAL